MLEIILTSPTFLIAIFLIAFLASSLLVLITKSLIWIITFIGVGSVLLSIIFFVFGAPFAGAFELSVGAGLISVLFIIATSLTRQSEENIE
jgi:NADH:ubiquinone oxidoreductase subunit 6 (subunit J)